MARPPVLLARGEPTRLVAEAAVQRKPLSAAEARKYRRNSYPNSLRSGLQPSSDRPQFSIRFPQLAARRSPPAAHRPLPPTSLPKVARLRRGSEPQGRQTGRTDPVPRSLEARPAPPVPTSVSWPNQLRPRPPWTAVWRAAPTLTGAELMPPERPGAQLQSSGQVLFALPLRRATAWVPARSRISIGPQLLWRRARQFLSALPLS